MKKAVLLTLVMMTSALAGCIGGESGTVEVELTDEQINDLFDEHFQDLLTIPRLLTTNTYRTITTAQHPPRHNTLLWTTNLQNQIFME